MVPCAGVYGWSNKVELFAKACPELDPMKTMLTNSHIPSSVDKHETWGPGREGYEWPQSTQYSISSRVTSTASFRSMMATSACLATPIIKSKLWGRCDLLKLAILGWLPEHRHICTQNWSEGLEGCTIWHTDPHCFRPYAMWCRNGDIGNCVMV